MSEQWKKRIVVVNCDNKESREVVFEQEWTSSDNRIPSETDVLAILRHFSVPNNLQALVYTFSENGDIYEHTKMFFVTKIKSPEPQNIKPQKNS